MSNPTLRYSLYRLGIFVAAFFVFMFAFRLIGLNGWGNLLIALALATATSAVISYKYLDAQREAMSEALYNRVQRAKQRIDEDTRAEDDVPAPRGTTTPATGSDVA